MADYLLPSSHTSGYTEETLLTREAARNLQWYEITWKISSIYNSAVTTEYSGTVRQTILLFKDQKFSSDGPNYGKISGYIKDKQGKIHYLKSIRAGTLEDGLAVKHVLVCWDETEYDIFRIIPVGQTYIKLTFQSQVEVSGPNRKDSWNIPLRSTSAYLTSNNAIFAGRALHKFTLYPSITWGKRWTYGFTLFADVNSTSYDKEKFYIKNDFAEPSPLNSEYQTTPGDYLQFILTVGDPQTNPQSFLLIHPQAIEPIAAGTLSEGYRFQSIYFSYIQCQHNEIGPLLLVDEGSADLSDYDNYKDYYIDNDYQYQRIS